MSERQKNSRHQYREFIKKRGVAAAIKHGYTPPENDDERHLAAKSSKYYFIRYIKEIGSQKGRLFLSMFLTLCSCLLAMSIPWTSKIMIDEILPKKDVKMLLLAGAVLLVIAILRHFVSLLEDYFKQVLRGRFIIDLKQRLMDKMHKLPLVELQKLKTGGIITRLQEDTEQAGNLVFNGFLTPFNAIILLIMSLSSLFFISWKTTIVCIFFVSLMTCLAYFCFYVMRPFQRSLCQDKSQINAELTESFEGIQVVKSFGRENTVKMDFAISSNLLWRKSIYSFLVGEFVHRSVWLIHFITEISIWMIGGYYFINGTLSIGSVVVFISFLMWIFQPIFMIMSSFSETQRCIACTERTIDLLDMEEEFPENENAGNIKRFEKELKFEQVSFKYPDGTLALNEIKLSIPKGKVTALVGPSGAGKTTITNLVLRFYDVSSGRISIDGTDIKDIRLQNYRKLISLVLQDVFLFDGTVKENIKFGRRESSDEEIYSAAKTAHCDDFIKKLSSGYDTVIGERGVKLSGGQKQRLALARALIANPQVLILDEATSNLDSQSEALIQDALRSIFKERTCIVIAHRLSTIMDADKIVVLDKGRIVEEGTHSELLAANGKYSEMYRIQMQKAGTLQNIWNSIDSEHESDN